MSRMFAKISEFNTSMDHHRRVNLVTEVDGLKASNSRYTKHSKSKRNDSLEGSIKLDSSRKSKKTKHNAKSIF